MLWCHCNSLSIEHQKPESSGNVVNVTCISSSNIGVMCHSLLTLMQQGQHPPDQVTSTLKRCQWTQDHQTTVKANVCLQISTEPDERAFPCKTKVAYKWTTRQENLLSALWHVNTHDTCCWIPSLSVFIPCGSHWWYTHTNTFEYVQRNCIWQHAGSGVG